LSDAAHTIAAIFRIELPNLVARLARVVRDVGRAEELAQDAMVIALERWPADGVPDNPGAWLMTTAKRRAIDQLRRAKLAERTHEELGQPPHRARRRDSVRRDAQKSRAHERGPMRLGGHGPPLRRVPRRRVGRSRSR
jgi:predicted RNA polymerase sigma factor